VQLYRFCDGLSGPLLGGMIVFSPWAFGTTQPWSIWAMNVAGYGLGLLLLLKLGLRWRTGYQPPRWDSERPVAQVLSTTLAVLSLAVLLYCLLGALNARATFLPDERRFEYHNCLAWLPHSYDSRSTWTALWTYLGLAGAFWGARDWLLGKSSSELRAPRAASAAESTEDDTGEGMPFPARLRVLLWLLAVNGALLGIESIVQRLANSPKLLFLVKPLIHQTADTQFGPYAYRANGAQYFNLLWPVCLGFWWMLNRGAGRGSKRHHLLLVCAILMASCPLISTSRAGAIIGVGMAVVGACFLLISHFVLRTTRRRGRSAGLGTIWAVLLFFVSAMTLGYSLGWDRLEPRMRELGTGFDGREAMYRMAEDMAQEFPVFGTGPGTYESVSELYRPTSLINAFWPAQVHNDWLETRITFGWVGSLLLYLLLAANFLRWFGRGGIHGGRRFVLLVWLAQVGCLLHARFDFPFQVYSVLFLFLLLCAMLSTLSRHP
jgi:hypothetical protein